MQPHPEIVRRQACQPLACSIEMGAFAAQAGSKAKLEDTPLALPNFGQAPLHEGLQCPTRIRGMPNNRDQIFCFWLRLSARERLQVRSQQALDRFDQRHRITAFERLVALLLSSAAAAVALAGVSVIGMQEQSRRQHRQLVCPLALGTVPVANRFPMGACHQAEAGDLGIKPADLVLNRAFVGDVKAGLGHPGEICLE